MMQITKSITYGRKLDDFLLFGPYWFPLIYLLILINFPSLSKLILGISLFLFAETHFASTWIFFFDKNNWKWIKDNYYEIILIPLFGVLIFSVVWNINFQSILLFHYLASGWHVTKQSVGILKLSNYAAKLKISLIYIFSGIFLAIGLTKPGLLSSLIQPLQFNILFFLILALYLFFNLYNSKLKENIDNFMPLFTGILIYIPILFIEDLASALAIGVGMHWIQYLALIWTIKCRKESINFKEPLFSLKKIFPIILFIFGYSFTMTSFTLNGLSSIDSVNNQISILYFIPILFQLFHFYIDGFIWKFSDPHIKKNVLRYIYRQ